jgi:hypothetical protein
MLSQTLKLLGAMHALLGSLKELLVIGGAALHSFMQTGGRIAADYSTTLLFAST